MGKKTLSGVGIGLIISGLLAIGLAGGGVVLWGEAAQARGQQWYDSRTEVEPTLDLAWSPGAVGWQTVTMAPGTTWAVWTESGAGGRCSLVRADGSPGHWLSDFAGRDNRPERPSAIRFNGVVYASMQFSADDNQVSADDDPIVVHVACITSSTFSVAPMPGPVVNYLPNRWAATTLVIAFAVDIVALLALSVILLTRRWSHR